MYDPTRLEWHSDDEAICEPRRVLCGLVVRQASLLNSFNRLAVALAKSQDHRVLCGVFAFGADRTPHDSKHPNRGGAEGKRSQYAARLGGSSRIIWSAGRIIKPRGVRYPTRSMMIPQGGETFPLYSGGVGGSLGEIY